MSEDTAGTLLGLVFSARENRAHKKYNELISILESREKEEIENGSDRMPIKKLIDDLRKKENEIMKLGGI